MPFKFNPITSELDEVTTAGFIPELTSDPVSPTPQTAWVLDASSSSGGGAIDIFIGGFPLTSAGTLTSSYTLKYRTTEGTTVSVALT